MVGQRLLVAMRQFELWRLVRGPKESVATEFVELTPMPRGIARRMPGRGWRSVGPQSPHLAHGLSRGHLATVFGTVGTGSGVYHTIDGLRNWDRLTPLQQDQLIGNLVTDAIFVGIGFAAKFFGCFTAETEVQTPPAESGGTCYAAAGFTLSGAVLVAAALWPRRRRRHEDWPNTEPDRIFADGEFEPGDTSCPIPTTNEQQFDELCDRLFHGGHDEPWWSAPIGDDDPMARSSPGSGSGTRLSVGCPGESWSRNAPLSQAEVDSPASVPIRLAVQPSRKSDTTAPPNRVKSRTSRRTSAGSASVDAWRRTLALATLAAGLLVAAFCGLPRGDVSSDATRPIAALRVGDKVVTDAPWQALAADHHPRGSNVKSLDFGPKPGNFNVLNVPDELYISARQFWTDYNRPWLDASLSRGDLIVFATTPNMQVLRRLNPTTGTFELTGFGREYLHLLKNGMKSKLQF